MPKISQIAIDQAVDKGDKLLGSDAGGGTRNYRVEDISKFIKDTNAAGVVGQYPYIYYNSAFGGNSSRPSGSITIDTPNDTFAFADVTTIKFSNKTFGSDNVINEALLALDGKTVAISSNSNQNNFGIYTCSGVSQDPVETNFYNVSLTAVSTNGSLTDGEFYSVLNSVVVETAIGDGGLTENNFTTALKNKLDGIEEGAEVNVQSDWNATSGDALILNKPTIPTDNSQLTNGAGFITSYTETDTLDSVTSRGNTTTNSISVGLTNTFGRFNVRGADNSGSSRAITVQNQSQSLIFDIYNDGKTYLNPQGPGNVMIGTTTDAGYKLNVNGSVATNGTGAFYAGVGQNTYANVLYSKSAYFNGGGSGLIMRTNYNQVNMYRVNFDDSFTRGKESFTLYMPNQNYSGSKIRITGQENGYQTQTLGTLSFERSRDSGDQGGYIKVTNDSTPSSTSQASYMAFGTTPSGSVSSTERMRITSDGDVLIGTTTDTGHKLSVNGRQLIKATTDGFESIKMQNFADTYSNRISFYKSNGTSKTVTLGDNGASAAYPFMSGMIANYGFVGNQNSGFHIFAASNVAQTFHTNGNVGIGTTTNAGYKLDVNGTARVSGEIFSGNYVGTQTSRLKLKGATGGTTSAYFITGEHGSSSTNLFNIKEDGSAYFKNLTTGNIYANRIEPRGSSTSLVFKTFSGNIYSASFQDGFNYNHTSGMRSTLRFGQSFLPTSGTGDFNNIILNHTVNQTGGANGTVRGIYYNPTLTSVLGDHIAIQTVSGKIIHQGLTAATHADQVYYDSTTGELTYGAAAGGSTPTLDEVTTAGNTTTNDITVSELTATERISLEADSTAITQTTAVIRATDTNSGIAIVPNGTGAIAATTAGDARGNYSIDLQRQRTNSNQVAIGLNGVLIGGRYNRVAGDIGVVVGGQNNQITGGGFNSILGGNANSIQTISTGYSVIGGGNSNTINVSGAGSSTISGGQSNTASTGTHATIVGGLSNTSSGQYSVSGGNSNTASGSMSVALGGFATASGNYSIVHSYAGAVSAQESAGFGARVRGYLRNCFSFSGGRFSSQGDRQFHEILRFGSPTLTTGATSTIATDLIPWNNNTAWNVKVETIAVVTSITGTADGVSVGDALMQDDSVLFARVGGTSSVVGTNNTNLIASTSMGDSSITYSAGSFQELEITFNAPTFTGGGSVTCRVVSKVSLVEVAW
jgi:hypothetical protein